MRCYLPVVNHSLPVAELWSGTVLVAGSGVRGQAEERGFELLCAVCWLRSGCQPGTAAGAGMLWKCRGRKGQNSSSCPTWRVLISGKIRPMKHSTKLSVQYSASSRPRECSSPGCLVWWRAQLEVGIWLWASRKLGQVFFLLLVGMIFVPLYSLQVVLQFGFIKILF